MKFFKSFLSFFTTITTAITAIVGVISLISGVEDYPPYITLQILGAGVLTAFVTVLIYSVDFKSKTHFLIMILIHYVLLCGVMAVLGTAFGWIDSSVSGIFLMCIYVAIVYAIVYAITFVLMKKEVDELNRALNERNKKD